jgi:hypothetical protein
MEVKAIVSPWWLMEVKAMCLHVVDGGESYSVSMVVDGGESYSVSMVVDGSESYNDKQ